MHFHKFWKLFQSFQGAVIVSKLMILALWNTNSWIYTNNASIILYNDLLMTSQILSTNHLHLFIFHQSINQIFCFQSYYDDPHDSPQQKILDMYKYGCFDHHISSIYINILLYYYTKTHQLMNIHWIQFLWPFHTIRQTPARVKYKFCSFTFIV